jgi:signal peptidase I
LFCYKKDVWSGETVADFETHMRKLSDAISRRDEKAVEEASGQLDKVAGEQSPPPKDAGIRENCEVLLVAIVIALGVRTYFLQPFTIPTGSMQPTLNGIIGHSTPAEPPPGILTRVAQTVLLGRGYIDVVCKKEGVIQDLKEFTRFRFFTYTQFTCGGVSYTVHAPLATLHQFFGMDDGIKFDKDEVIARGYIDTGDHVFVDKFTYNFRAPRRGEVFVFNTAGIPTNESRNADATSQFYIKRVGGLPGDELRIDPPVLYQNGAKAAGYGYERVMQGRIDAPVDGYQGYSNTAQYSPTDFRPMRYLTDPESTFRIPAKCYFALGDNSYHSSDSRDWGTVPQRNIVGRGLLVYWPFASHWGLIK